MTLKRGPAMRIRTGVDQASCCAPGDSTRAEKPKGVPLHPRQRHGDGRDRALIFSVVQISYASPKRGLVASWNS